MSCCYKSWPQDEWSCTLSSHYSLTPLKIEWNEHTCWDVISNKQVRLIRDKNIKYSLCLLSPSYTISTFTSRVPARPNKVPIHTVSILFMVKRFIINLQSISRIYSLPQTFNMTRFTMMNTVRTNKVLNDTSCCFCERISWWDSERLLFNNKSSVATFFFHRCVVNDIP